MTLVRSYYRSVVNDAGYVLLFPNVGDAADLLQSHPVNPYAESKTQQFPLGTILIQGERGWWYCKNAATGLSTLGTPTQSAAAHHAEADDNIVVGAAAAIGDTEVSLTSTTNLDDGIGGTKDAFAEGYIYFNLEAGIGQCYKIKANEAFATTAKSIFTLYDPLTIALTTSSRAGIVQHPCRNVVAAKAVVTGIFTGIPPLAITADYYFWNQIAGPAAIVGNATIAKGSYVVIGTTAGKADPGAAYTTEIIIGYPLTPCVTTDAECFMVMLTGHLL